MESKIPNKERPLILVAEDDESNFKLIKAIINNRCDVLWARNGQEMLNLYEQHGEQADVLLMVLKMPLMDGLEATRIIRQSSPDIPIIVRLTGTNGNMGRELLRKNNRFQVAQTMEEATKMAIESLKKESI